MVVKSPSYSFVLFLSVQTLVKKSVIKTLAPGKIPKTNKRRGIFIPDSRVEASSQKVPDIKCCIPRFETQQPILP